MRRPGRSGTSSRTPTTCPAGGRAPSASRTSPRAAATEGRKWTQVLETRDGRAIRADYRCVGAATAKHYTYEQLVEGTPFEGFLVSATTEIRLEPEGVGTEVTLREPPAPAGALPPGRVHDAAGDRPHPGRGAAGPGASGCRLSSSGGGGGPPTIAKRTRGDAGRRSRAELGVEPGDAERAGRARAGGRCRRRARFPTPCAPPRRAGELLSGDEDRIAAPRVAATRTWSGCAPASSSWPRTPSPCRPPPSRSPRCSRPAPRPASPWCRSAAAPASSAASTPSPGSHSAVLSLDLAELRSVEIDRTSLTARLGPGLRGPEAEGALGELGATLGHFPQSYEQATIGGYAATRSAGQASTGYGRFDELVTAIELTAPDGRAAHPADPAQRRRSIAARARARLGGHPGRDHRRHLPRAPDAGGSASTRAGSPPTSPRAPRSCAPWRRTTRRPTCCASPTRRRPGSRWSSRAAEGMQKRALDAYLSLRRRRGGCLMICGYEGERESVRGAARSPRGGCARAAPCRSGRGRETRGRRRASRGPTCATSCWGWGSSSRRSRPRTPGAAWTSSTGRGRRAPRRAGLGLDRDVPHLARLRGRRLALLHLPRPRPAGRRARAVARRPRPPPARRSSRARGRSPTTTPSAATTRPTWPPRSASWASTRCAPSRSASTPPGS